MLFSSDGNNILISKIDIFEPTCNVLIIIATKTAEVNRKYKSLICLAAESSYISPVWSTLQETGNEVINIFILCFPIAHNTLCLPPKFSINYFFFQILLGGLHIPKTKSLRNLGANKVHYGQLENRKLVISWKVCRYGTRCNFVIIFSVV